VYLHPALLARRAAEIARSQGCQIGRDSRGRPFILAAAEPEGPRGQEPEGRLERLIPALYGELIEPPTEPPPAPLVLPGRPVPPR
jgi:hypothetical protein